MHKTPPENEGESIFESPYLKNSSPPPLVGQAYNLSKLLATPVDNIHNNGILKAQKVSFSITFSVNIHVYN